MTQVHLHVGMPKCASTTLQRFFADNDEQHRREGLCYPVSHRSPTGYRSHRPLHAAGVDQIGSAVEEIAREAESNRCDTVVLSSEEFTNSLWDADVSRVVVEALNERFGADNVRVVFLIRNYFKFVESTYAQYLWAGMFRVPRNAFLGKPDSGIDEYVRWFRRTNGFHFFEYSAFATCWQDLAPGNSIDVQSIEHADLGDDGLIGWLRDRYQLPAPEHTKAANTRVNGATLRALHRARAEDSENVIKGRRGVLQRTFRGSSDAWSPLLHLSEELVGTVRGVVDHERQWFEAAGSPLTEAVTSVPAGFPRDFGEDRPLTESEVAAIRYILQDAEPRPRVARRILAGRVR